MVIGGAWKSCTISGRYYAISGDSNVVMDLGGDENEIQSNGDGSARTISKTKPWRVSGVGLVINDAKGDLEFAQQEINSHRNLIFTFTKKDNTVYEGVGTIVESFSVSSDSSAAEAIFSGPFSLNKQ